MTPARMLLWLLAGSLCLPGCATLGAAIKLGGQATGYSELTDMGSSMEKAGREFTEEEKYYIGRTVAATLLADARLDPDERLLAYVNSIGYTLVLASGRPELFHGYHFGVQAAEKVNAFACPGGFLPITRGLVRLCRNEDELAAVLAHEIAHIVLEHPMQAIQASHQRAAVASLIKFGVKKAGEDNEDIAQLSGLFDSVVKDVAKAVAQGYSRDKEKEADLMAADILSQAGYSPLALASVLRRMDARSCYHGDPQIRAADVESAARSMGGVSQPLGARTQRFAKEAGR